MQMNGTAGNTVKDLLLPNTVNKKDETPHTAAGLDDTATPHIKIKITMLLSWFSINQSSNQSTIQYNAKQYKLYRHSLKRAFQ